MWQCVEGIINILGGAYTFKMVGVSWASYPEGLVMRSRYMGTLRINIRTREAGAILGNREEPGTIDGLFYSRQ